MTMAPHRPRDRSRRPSSATILLTAILTLALLPLVGMVGVSLARYARAVYGPPQEAVTPTPGMILMTEGPLEMQMTPLSNHMPSRAELARVTRLAHQARAVMARYRDLKVAQRDGYRTAPGLFVPTQGAHYRNETYDDAAASGQFDPAHPPFLVYNTAHSEAALSGLLYVMPADATPRQLAAIVPPALGSWHQHINLCVVGGPGVLDWQAILPIHDPKACRARPGASFLDRTGWMIHLWVGQPIGRMFFAMDRPGA
jgi:hypothetical protein